MSDKNHYTIVDGKVVTRSLEAHIVDHCNLRCRQCCSLSPYLEPAWTEPERLAQDLVLAKRVLRPTYFKLVGGEPLLHPRLVECLEAVRHSAMAEIVSLTTNGVLLPQAPEAMWRLLDHMTLSLYPKPRLSAERLDEIRAQADRFGVELNIKTQDRFEQMHLDHERADPTATRDVFAQCWLRRRCHLIRDGYFYTCTLPVHRQSFQGSAVVAASQDGLRLHAGPGLVEELKAYLERRDPLRACSQCLGGQGELFAHRQLHLREIENRDLACR
ncbi:MAG: radical SAM protein [Acidobacteriota bacterium]